MPKRETSSKTRPVFRPWAPATTRPQERARSSVASEATASSSTGRFFRGSIVLSAKK